MFKSFFFGVLLGIAGVAAFLHFVPVVDQGRQRSITSVQPNGGTLEEFHVNLPGDRIFAGSGAGQVFPEEAKWPTEIDLDGAQAELFKLRNAEEQVVGVASRLSSTTERPFVEWVLHMPARGSMYVIVDPRDQADGRAGRLHSGTREFAALSGSIIERFVAGASEDAGGTGRLELLASLVGQSLPDVDETMEAGL